MRYEIERKFLVSGFLNEDSKVGGRYKHFTQDVIYLSTDPEVRFKKTSIMSEHSISKHGSQITGTLPIDGKTYIYSLTMKGNGDLTRMETEDIEVSEETYSIAVSLAKGAPISRDIREYELEDGTILDIVHVLNADRDFYYAEVEFESEEDALNWDMCVLKEILICDATYDPYYKMKNVWKRSREMRYK